MIKVKQVSKSYFLCTSCQSNINVKEISMGIEEKQTSSFRLCENCINELKKALN